MDAGVNFVVMKYKEAHARMRVCMRAYVISVGVQACCKMLLSRVR